MVKSESAKSKSTAAKLGTLAVRPVGIGLCAPIDARLDQLLVLARGAGRRSASRAAIVASLILASPTTGAELLALLDGYEQQPEDRVLIPGIAPPTFDNKKPGRRKVST